MSLTRSSSATASGNALPEQESAELYERWAIPSPGRPLFEAAMANLSPRSAAKVDTRNAIRGPLLLTAGGKDHTVPAAVTRSTMKLYRRSPAVTTYREFPDRGHTLALDHGWRDVAHMVLLWLKEQGSSAASAQPIMINATVSPASPPRVDHPRRSGPEGSVRRGRPRGRRRATV